MDLPDRLRHYIEGAHVDSVSGATFDVLDPVTNETYVRAAAGEQADVDRAVAAALVEFEEGTWRTTNATTRGKVLLRVSQLLRERAEDFAVAEARNSGHPIGNARWEANTAADVFEYFAGAANKHYGQTVPVQEIGRAHV